MNLAIIKGRLTRDPEFKTVGARNMAVCEFCLAVPDKIEPKNKEKTYFANCIAWGKLADIIKNYCTRGQEILIVGRNHTKEWTKDGVKHLWPQIIVDSMEFCGNKSDAQKAAEEPPW